MLHVKRAYLQIEVDKKGMMIEATNGVYHINRLMFGISMAPAMLEDKTKIILTNVEGVRTYYDFVEGKDLKQNRLTEYKSH